MGLWNYCFGDFYMKDDVITPNCKACRIRLEKTGPARLFLLPCWHGERYQHSSPCRLTGSCPRRDRNSSMGMPLIISISIGV